MTDLSRKGRRTTTHFFSGTKPEYPRRMRCIQGSDSHNLTSVREKGRVITLGVGERTTEVLLKDRSFDELLKMFQSTDFSRSRPYNPDHQPEDYIQSARAEGATVVQSFHESMARKGGKLHKIIADVCAFANTNGGTVYIGLSADKKKNPVGVSDVQNAITTLQDEISGHITPGLNVEIDARETQGKTVIRVQVPFGEERPYAIDNTKIYVRDDSDSNLAVRDEIVNLVRQRVTFAESVPAVTSAAPTIPENTVSADIEPSVPPPAVPEDEDTGKTGPPRAGVEIVGVEQRGDTRYYIMRDLRNGNIVKNVTRSSARRLWHYAITQNESNPIREDKILWKGEIGLWRSYKKSGHVRYDLTQRDNGNLRVYYGVTENGMQGAWQQFLVPED